METRTTALVIVGGSPGSGKTTLAHKLSADLGFPLLSRDSLKEVLLETLGAADRQASQRLGAASYALLYSVVESLIGRVPGVVVESNFARGRSEVELRPLVERTHALLVHCETTAGEVERRIRARDNRHPGHFDVEALPSVLNRLTAGAFDPLELSLPIIRVDTTSGYDPPTREIVSHIRAGREERLSYGSSLGM